MKFSEEMKMLQQVRQLSLMKKTDTEAVEEDYQELLQKILSDLKEKIRKGIVAGAFDRDIAGDYELSPFHAMRCAKIPRLGDEPKLYYYETVGSIHMFHWLPLCIGKYDGKRMASKNVCIELTAAGEKLLADFSALAKAEGIHISCQPALHTKTDESVVLPKFGTYEKVANPKHMKKGALSDFYINVHYMLE